MALYAAIAQSQWQTPTPVARRAMARLSRAADRSRLSLAAAAVLAATAVARHVRMPSTTSFRSGHSAAAFALATGVGDVLQLAAIPLCAPQSPTRLAMSPRNHAPRLTEAGIARITRNT